MPSLILSFLITTLINLSLATHHGLYKSQFRPSFKSKHFHSEKPYAVDPADQLDTRDIELAKAAFDLQDDAENERVKGDLQLGEEINKITSQNTYFGPRFSDTDEEPLIKDGVLRSSILKPRKHDKRKVNKKHMLHRKNQKNVSSRKTTVESRINKRRREKEKTVTNKSSQKKSVVKKANSNKHHKHAKAAKKHQPSTKKHQRPAKKHTRKTPKHFMKHKNTAAASTHKKLPALKKFYAKDYGDQGDDYIENYKPENKEEDFERFKNEPNEHSEEDNVIDKMRQNAGYGDSEQDGDRFEDGRTSFSRNNNDDDNENEDKDEHNEPDEQEEEGEHEQHEDNDEADGRNEAEGRNEADVRNEAEGRNDESEGRDEEEEEKDEEEAEEKQNFNEDTNGGEEDQGIIKQSNDKMEVADNGLVFNQETGTINENLLKKNPSYGRNPGDTYVDDEMRNSGIDKKSKNGGQQQATKQNVKLPVKEKTTGKLKVTKNEKTPTKVIVSQVQSKLPKISQVQSKLPKKVIAKEKEEKASKKSDLLERHDDDSDYDAEDKDDDEDDDNEDLW